MSLPASPQPAVSEAVGPSLPHGLSSPEFELLLASCAAPASGELAARIQRLVQAKLDWDFLVRLAEHHGLVPSLYRAVTPNGSLLAEGLEKLGLRFEANARQTLWLTRELLRILDRFDSAEIPALPYKGPVLAELLFGNVALRQFSDLDILVRAADVPRAKRALQELGYKPGIELTQYEERAYLASGYEYTFDGAEGRNLVEVQWQILPRFYSVDFEIEKFFQKASTVSCGGRQVRTLCREDLLLVLCVHAAKHAWVQLSWLRDIAELVRSQPLDWRFVQQQARALGIEGTVAVTFYLIRQFLGATLPNVVEERFPPSAEIRSLGNEILAIIARSTEYNTESVAYFRLMMRLRERWRDRMRFLLRLAFTPGMGEWAAVRLPAPLFPLYRVVRGFRLMGRLIAAAPGKD